MKISILILSLPLFLNCWLTPSHFALGQCLSDKDDLSLAVDHDLSGIQEFNIELFKHMIPKSSTENFVFSPYSIWNALVLAYFGSAGETQKQFEQVLRLKDKISTLRKWRHLEFLYKMRPETSVNNTFVLSNRAYFDITVNLHHCMDDILHSEISNLDFFRDPHGSAEVINDFVNETTRGHISELVSPSDVTFAYMVLVNAAYFQGFWASTFDPEDTKSLPFHQFTGGDINVPMMSQTKRFKYGFSDLLETEILELPYIGGVVSMYLLLPYDPYEHTFRHLVNTISHTELETLINDMFETPMFVSLPKFTLETVAEEELLQALNVMGLKDAFISKANFTDFSFNPNVKLDRGIHKAFIDVNEEGTEAAAATGFIANKIGGNSDFICNRPFIFAIRDNDTKNILFMGAVKSPSPDQPDQLSNPSSTNPPYRSSFGDQSNTSEIPSETQSKTSHYRGIKG